MKKYKISEVMKLFEITRGTVYNWDKANKLEIIKEGKKTFVVLSQELTEELSKKNNESIDFKGYALEQNVQVYKNKFTKSEEKVKELQKVLLEKSQEIDTLKAKYDKLKNNTENFDGETISKQISDINIKLDKLSSKFDTILDEIEKSNSGFFKKLFK